MLDPEPWDEHLFGVQQKCLAATGGSGDKERAKPNFNAWLKALYPLDIVIYTDGSQEIDKAGVPTGTGAGWLMH